MDVHQEKNDLSQQDRFEEGCRRRKAYFLPRLRQMEKMIQGSRGRRIDNDPELVVSYRSLSLVTAVLVRRSCNRSVWEQTSELGCQNSMKPRSGPLEAGSSIFQSNPCNHGPPRHAI